MKDYQKKESNDMAHTSGTEFGSFSYISSIDSAYRLDAPEMKLSLDLLA